VATIEELFFEASTSTVCIITKNAYFFIEKKFFYKFISWKI